MQYLLMAVVVITLMAAGCDSPQAQTTNPVPTTPITEKAQSVQELIEEAPSQEPVVTQPVSQPIVESPKIVTPPPAQPKQEAPKTVSQPKSNCNPNYSGCVPIASDVDCAGGSGDGPAYVSGPISVIGSDIYGLDRDKDGIACE